MKLASQHRNLPKSTLKKVKYDVYLSSQDPLIRRRDLKQLCFICLFLCQCLFGVSDTLNRQISHKVKFGVGADISYNEGFGADTIWVNFVPVSAPFERKDKFLVGAYGSFELILGRVSMIIQPGYYLYKKEVEWNDTPSAYQRIGIKYHLFNNLVAGVNNKSIFGYFYNSETLETRKMEAQDL